MRGKGKGKLEALKCSHFRLIVDAAGTQGDCPDCNVVLTGPALVLSLLNFNKLAHDQIEEAQSELKKALELKTFKIECVRLIGGIMNALPFPTWIHPVKTLQWFINDAYCDRFHVSRPTFCSPINILENFPFEIASKFLQEDLDVIAGGKSLIIPPQLLCDRLLEPPSLTNPQRMVSVMKSSISMDSDPAILGIALTEDNSSFFESLTMIQADSLSPKSPPLI